MYLAKTDSSDEKQNRSRKDAGWKWLRSDQLWLHWALGDDGEYNSQQMFLETLDEFQNSPEALTPFTYIFVNLRNGAHCNSWKIPNNDVIINKRRRQNTIHIQFIPYVLSKAISILFGLFLPPSLLLQKQEAPCHFLPTL